MNEETDLALLANIIRSSDDAIISKALDSTITSWNPAAEKLFGYTPEEIIGKPITLIIPTELLYQESEIIHKMENGEIIEHFETVRKRKDGTLIDVSISVSPIKTDGGKIIGASKIARDITQRKKAEAALFESEKFNRALLDSINFHLAVVNRDGTIITTNRAWDNFAKENGIKSLNKVLAGSNYFSACETAIAEGDTFASLALEGIHSVLEKRKSYFELQYPCDSPTKKRWFLLRVISFDDNRVITIHDDVTDKKEAEIQLERSEKRFRSIIEHGSDIITLQNQNLNVFYRSPSVHKIVGYNIDSGELLAPQSPRDELIHPDDKLSYQSIINKALKNPGETYELNFRYLNDSGEYRQLTGYVTNHLHDDAISAIVENLRDVTDQKKLEQELLQDKFFLEKASETGKIGYWSSEPGYEDGKLTWSKEVFKIFGIDEKDFTGTNKDFFERIHPDDLSRVVEFSRRAFESDSIYEVDHRIILPTGAVRWVSEKGRVERDAKNKPTLMVGVVQDINDRKIIEEVLREYNDRYEILSKATKDVIWDWDIKNDRVLYNNSLYDILGYSPDTVSGESTWWEDRLHPDDHDLVMKNMKDVFSKRISGSEFSYRFRTKTGEYKHINDRSFVIYDKNGSPVRMIGAMQDVTEVTEYRLSLEQKVIERTRELNEALQKEKELADMRNRFVSTASHEFRTPLSSIELAAGHIKKFKNKMSAADIDRKLLSINIQVKHMTALLADVLTVGKSEAGKIEVDWVEVDLQNTLSQLVKEVVNSTKKTHKIKLVNRCTLQAFKTDEGLLRNIIINLLTNAIKFSPSAKVVDLTVDCTERYVTFTVRDYGIGIPTEELERIFEPFYRVKSTGPISGTGLGLSILKKAADLLGGKVDVKSVPGGGSEFIITLPIQ